MKLSQTELSLFRDIVSLPTAPFFEKAVQSFVKDWASRSCILYKEDRSGNILLEYKGKGRQKLAPWVLQAHMDHPGFVCMASQGRIAQAVFMGGVSDEYFQGSKVSFLPENGPAVNAEVTSVTRNKENGFLDCTLLIEQAVSLRSGTVGMWAVPVWKKSGDILSLRAADDLAGTASVLLALQRLVQTSAPRRALALLTRAEEVGFIGAIAATKSGIIDKAYPVLGIETSKAQKNTPLGSGVVIRVGDKMSIFDAELSMHLKRVAEYEQAKYPCQFNYTVAVMPGGSTESTALALSGYRTCAVCLPLGNYHNMAKKGISCEKISISDLNSLVSLLTSVTQYSVPNRTKAQLVQSYNNNYKIRRKYLNGF